MQQQIEEAPLYDPIQFVYDGVIGSKASQYNQTSSYEWGHKEIVRPQPSCKMIEYILYHTPCIYNWLKTVEATERTSLNNYLIGKPTGLKTSLSKNLLWLMIEYAEKWEVVRLAYQCQFYVEKADCQHISKKTLWSLDYLFKFRTNSLVLESTYCKHCDMYIDIESSQVKKYPEVVITKKRQQKLELGGQTYDLFLVILNEVNCQLLIKIAGGQWYQIKNKSIRVISSELIPKNAEKWFYTKHRVSDLELRPAVLAVQPKQDKITVEPIIKRSIEIEPQVKTDNAEKKPVKQKSAKQRVTVFQAIKLKPLKEQIYVPQTYKPAGSYTNKIIGQYPKEKIKDQYDIEYDQGKVKKIKTKRIKKQIDFNELHRKVKQGLIQDRQPKKVYRDHNDSTRGFFRK